MSSRTHSRYAAFAAACALLAAAGPGLAQEAGSVTFATGDVTAARQPPVALAKGDTVLVSDVVVTGTASRAQLLMIDGAKIAIRPSSRVVVAEYSYAEAAATPGAVVTSADDSSVLELVKGGLRTITGAIGDQNPEDYEVRTAVGVLGIRGTDFAVLLCSGDCAFAPGVAAGTPVPDGLYVMVTDGIVVFGNEVAEIVINAGEFVYIPFDTREPERLDAPPPVFIDDSDLQFVDDTGVAGQAGTDDDTPAGFDAALGTRRSPDPDSSAQPPEDPATEGDESRRDAPAQSIRGIDADGQQIDLTPGGAPDPQNRSITWSGGPLDQAATQFSATLVNLPDQYRLDAGNNLTGFFNEYPAVRVGGGNADFAVGTAANVETGFDSATVLRWGRWSGGVASIILTDGTDVSQDLGAQSLHWVSSPQYAQAPVLPVAGVANYSLVGGTAPTDNAGNTGILGSATFQADFLNMAVTSTLDIQINGSSWQAAGNGGIGTNADPVVPAHLFNGSYGAVVIDGQTGGFGTFSGFFSEPGPSSDPAFPGGVGLTYSLQDAQGATTVSGAAAFGNP
ncbi:MAG: FecR family protein [Woeseiaceae bacterium]|nr:FecR family protein [Woeseiaceae bacterium]